MISIEHQQDENGHRVVITSDDETEDGELGPADSLVFTFTHEGLVTDATENGVVIGTSSGTYGEIIDGLQ